MDKIINFDDEGSFPRRFAQSIIDAFSHTAVAILDRDMKYLAVSERWISDHHLGDQSIIGRGHYEIFPETSQSRIESFRRSLNGEVQKSEAEPSPRADGSTGWARWEIRPWLLMDGSIGGIIICSEDITEQTLANSALRESEANYRSLIESASDGIFVSDSSGHFADFNAAGCLMFGYSREELLQLSIADVVESHDAKRIEPEIERLKDGEVVRSEWQCRRKNGDTFPVEVGATILPNGNLFGILREITQRRQAEDALRLMRFSVDQAGDGVFWISPEARLLYVNKSACQQLGYTESELLNMTVFDIDPDFESSGWGAHLEQLKREGAMTFESRHRTKSGRIFPVEVNASYVLAGAEEFNFAITRDITERKQAAQALRESEERFRLFMDNSPTIAWIKDDQSRYVYLSKTFEERFGVRMEDCRGKTDSELWPPELAEQFKRNDQGVLSSDKAKVVTEETWNSDGEACHWLTSKFPFRSVAGERFVAGIGLDVTEIKQAEIRIQQLNRVYAMLSGINETIVREKDPQLMLEAACRLAVEKGRFRMAWIGLAAKGESRIRIAAQAGATDDTVRILEMLITGERPDCAMTFHALKTGLQGVCNDIEHDPRTVSWREAALERGYRSMASLPLKDGETTIGTLNLYAGEPGFFDEAELCLLDDLASDVSFALKFSELENERRAAQERHARQRSELIALTGQTGIEGRDVLAVLRQITESAAQTLSAAWVGIWRFNTDHTALECTSLFESLTNRHTSGAVMSLTDYPIYFGAIADGEVLAVSDAANDPRMSEFVPGAPDVPGVISLLDVPINLGGENVGILRHGHFGSPRQWMADEKTFAVGMANLVSLSLEGWERRQAETELRWKTALFEALVDSTPDGILVVDNHGRKIVQNQRVNELFKIPRHIYEDTDDSLQVRFVSGRVKDPEQFTRKVAWLYSNQVETSQDVVELVDETILERYSSPVQDKAGNYYGRIWGFRDITERKHLEDQLRQSQKLEAVGMLAGGIAHDFNNLLTVISGYCDLLLFQLRKDDPLHRSISEITKAAERASGLTRQLLAFSRKQILNPKILDLNTVVLELEKMLTRVIGEDIELSTVLEPNLGSVKADPGQIDQIIMNFAVNARDAMPRGGKLTIETKNVFLDEDYARTHIDIVPGPHVLLAVSDSGLGMDQSTLSRIFEPFFTTKETGRGTGLGLSTVYGIVKQSNGDIVVESKIGVGTTFKVYLPREDEYARDSKSGPSVVAATEGTETILLAEDEEMVRNLTRQVLEMNGYRVLEAANGGAALLICENYEGQIHLLVTDVIMPEMSGPELAARLEQLRPEMKVLFMSGYTSDAAGHEGIPGNAANFIQKPYPIDALARKVREVLDESS